MVAQVFHEYNQNDYACIADLFLKVAYVAYLILSQQELGQLDGLLGCFLPSCIVFEDGFTLPTRPFQTVFFVEQNVHSLNVSFTPSLLSTFIEPWLSMVLRQSASACPHHCASFI